MSIEDFASFFDTWANFDPDFSHYIEYSKLPDFLDSLGPPLQIGTPNYYKIVHFDIPIVRRKGSSSDEELVYHKDVVKMVSCAICAHYKENTKCSYYR